MVDDNEYMGYCDEMAEEWEIPLDDDDDACGWETVTVSTEEECWDAIGHAAIGLDWCVSQIDADTCDEYGDSTCHIEAHFENGLVWEGDCTDFM